MSSYLALKISIVLLHHHRHISIVFPPPPLYIFRLANHLTDVHQLDHIQRRQYLHEWKLQPKVKAVVYESEADNSAKKITQPSTRSPVQTQETVYELSRSRLEAIGKLCRHGRIIYYSS